MHVSLSGWQPGDAPRDAVEIASDLAGPHTILPQPDGTLWISEHFTGRIVAIIP